MAITVTISTNRQIKTSDGGSIGATAGMTVELVTPATATDAEIQREIRHHYETVTGAMTDQLRHLAAQRTTPTPAPTPPAAPANGSANGTANGNGKAAPAPAAPTNPPATKAPAPQRAAKAPAPPAPAPATTPLQPAEARNAMLTELDRQFGPSRAPTAHGQDGDFEDEDDIDDDTDPRNGIELLGWARSKPGDAKQELAQIGHHRGFPRLIKEWSPTMVATALQIYRRTSRD